VDRARIKSYCDEAVKNGCVQVNYKTKGEVGRLYPTNPYLTATTMWGRVRATLFNKTELDIDIVNCHACILLDIMEEYYPDFSVPCLREYVKNRNSVIEEFQIHKECPYFCQKRQQLIRKKDIIKSLFNIILYGGTVKTWAKTWDLKEGEYEITEFVEDFQAEVQQMTSLVINHKAFKPVKIEFCKYKQEKKQKELGD